MTRFHPYHGADGRLWPELDERVVGLSTIAAYEQISRATAYARFLSGHYGRPGQTAGIWMDAKGAGKRPIIRARPAVVWRLRSFGRWAALPGFDPRSVREPIYTCRLTDTINRQQQPAPIASAPTMGDFLRTITQAIAAQYGMTAEQIMPRPENVLAFPSSALAR